MTKDRSGSVKRLPAEPGETPVGSTDADYRLMVEAVTDYAIFLLDPQGHIRSWNAGARRLKGYEAGDVIGRHFSIFYPQEQIDAGWPLEELRLATERGRMEDEGWRLRKDGTRFWANIIITRLQDAQGRLRGFSKITRDLTERRRHEQLLRQSEERFRLLVEGVQDYAIFMLDPSGHVVSWNAGAQKAKGYAEREIVGRHFSVFYPEDVAASGWPDQELELALRDGRFEDEGWRVRKDGSRFWASVVITALRDESGRHRGFAKVTRDLTDRTRISVLEDEGKRILTFLAMLGHEMRNPLSPITNALTIMEMAAGDPAAHTQARGVIRRQVDQLSRLVDDLLDVGRITAGKIALQRRPLRVEDVAAEALEVVGPALRNKEHAVDLDVRDPDLWVNGDPVRLRQVLGNLLSNAAKFTPRGGEIGIVIERSGSHARISVRDNGPGIAPALLPRIFELFVQGDQHVDRAQAGLGLGLPLVRQLVALHGGEVTAHSAGVRGKGSEFRVCLPLTAPPAGTVLAAQAAPRVAPMKVLVVDDNHDSADTMCVLLRTCGYAAVAAYDGNEAVRVVHEQKPDVALVDLGLPGLDGCGVARRVLAESKPPPVLVAMTGHGLDTDRDTSLAAGFYAHMTKPVRVDDLLAVLQRVAVEAGRPAAG